MANKAIVVDANILVRAVLGKRVREVIERYAGEISFFVPDVALAEAEEHLPKLARRRGGDPEKALAFLRLLAAVVDVIGHDVYGEFRGRSAKPLATTRSGGLADSCCGAGVRVPNLDRGHRFLRVWSRHLDNCQCAIVPRRGGEITGMRLLKDVVDTPLLFRLCQNCVRTRFVGIAGVCWLSESRFPRLL